MKKSIGFLMLAMIMFMGLLTIANEFGWAQRQDNKMESPDKTNSGAMAADKMGDDQPSHDKMATDKMASGKKSKKTKKKEKMGAGDKMNDHGKMDDQGAMSDH